MSPAAPPKPKYFRVEPYSPRSPTVLIFEFQNGVFEYSATSTRSHDEALAERQGRRREVVETQLVVLAKKGGNGNPIAHKLAHLERANPNVAFVAVMDAAEFRKLCDEADAAWNAEKEALRTQIRQLAHDTQKAKLEDLPARLRARVSVTENGCWFWPSLRRRNKRGNLRPHTTIDPDKYGSVGFEGKRWRAHRLVYALLVGAIPDGVLLRHDCDTPACVNPRHLRLGIAEDNYDDMVSRGRQSSRRSGSAPRRRGRPTA